MGDHETTRSRRVLVGTAVAGLMAGTAVVPLILLSSLGRGSEAVRSSPSSPFRSSSSLPDAAEIVCDADGTHLVTPKIRPQADGVHFRIDNRTGKHLAFMFRFGERPGGGDNALVGRSEVTRSDVPPGPVMVTCFDFGGQAPVPKDSSGFVALDVIDQDKIWTSPDLQCQAGWVSGIGDYVTGARGQRGDPVDLAREHFTGLRATDVVKRSGYPGQSSPVVAVVREGETIATAEYESDGSGGWLLSTVSRCQDSGLIG